MSQAPTRATRSDLAQLRTEQTDPRYAQIDRLPTAELAALMNEADSTVPGAVRDAIPALVPAIDAVVDKLSAGGRLLYVGAGTPGRIGLLDAAECPPTFGTAPDQVRGIIAGGPTAVTGAVEGVEDDADAGAADVATAEVGPGDAVVGLTASGRTPYVLAALAEARRRGAATIGLSCNAEAELSAVVEYPVEIAVGPEFVAGSTRLKAGTAQKLVLNMISTISMVRIGKTHGNLMVDLVATNQKLQARAIRMVQEITGATPEVAESALAGAGRHVKTAVVMIERDVDAGTARALLDTANGRLSAALALPTT
ncbi:N-acetylmuramic acid 6-phosphate etherase [Actinocatenispora rupis]|uniref:N-acetylmuramic acid 6-phosphate etherase n=1 Tax=Actinocatenispora rupis TaxID=519421 RepID=A0A8J3NEA7_9ACTN|nr:N-acetylmuramic acid 6-phosphate etherase [Actinocatenispora rupis]GID13745.1 N-acetylmuramic acid 6-phosphate etherase [Actinocatenispora rupis]